MTNKLSKHPAPVVHRVAEWRVGHYQGKELKQAQGIPDSRFDAYRLPSRIGDKLIYPKHNN